MSIYVILHLSANEPLILPNTSISLSAISYQSSAISYKLSAISYKLAYQSSAIFAKQSLDLAAKVI
jgi:hypothetical protein